MSRAIPTRARPIGSFGSDLRHLPVIRGPASIQRLQQRYLVIGESLGSLIHGPIHERSWLNQVEIYFSIVQRKVLTPNDFPWPVGALLEPAIGSR